MTSEVRTMGQRPPTMDEPRSGEVRGSDEGGAPGAEVRSTQVPMGAGERSDPAPPGGVSGGLADDAARNVTPAKRRPKKKLKGDVVATRFDADGLAILAELTRELGASSKAAALRQCVEIVAEKMGKELSGRERALPARSQPVLAPAALAAEAAAAARELAEQYSRRAREVYAIGNNINQITRLANAEGHAPSLAVLAGIESQLVAIRRQLNADAERDEKLVGLLQRLKEL